MPLALGAPVTGAGPFTAPLGGGLCVTALVLAGAAALSAERRARAPFATRIGLALAAAGLALAVAIEWHLIRRGHAEDPDRSGPRSFEPSRRTP